MFGPYRLEEVIGRGGMGEVHRAFDTTRKRTVAIKRMTKDIAADDGFQARFRRESEVVARLSEPHIIPIHDYGVIEGRLFIDMRLVAGLDLGELVRRQGPLPVGRAVDIVSQVASALDAAHESGVVHRDVKPSNVLITSQRGQDFVYLVDFGTVRAFDGSRPSLTTTGTAIGTPAYMAPELFTGARVDRRVDVYALACLLSETLTGRQPFSADGLPAMMYAHLHQERPRPSTHRRDIPAGVDGVLARGMAVDPGRRFASAGEFADAARAVVRDGRGAMSTTVPASAPAPDRFADGGGAETVTGSPTTEPRIGTTQVRPKPPRRFRRLRMAAVLVAALVLVVAGVALDRSALIPLQNRLFGTGQAAPVVVAAPAGSGSAGGGSAAPTASPAAPTGSSPAPAIAPVGPARTYLRDIVPVGSTYDLRPGLHGIGGTPFGFSIVFVTPIEQDVFRADYQINRRFSTFHTIFAINDEFSDLGSSSSSSTPAPTACTLQVYVDGQQRSSQTVTQGKPTTVDVPTTEGVRLQIAVAEVAGGSGGGEYPCTLGDPYLQ